MPPEPSRSPYSHAVASGELVYLSGQTPLDSRTGKLVEGDSILRKRKRLCSQKVR